MFHIFFIDGMAYRDSYTSWFDKSKSDEKQMLDSFAGICRNKKVSLYNTVQIRLYM